MYKPIYDDKHRMHEISTDPKVPNRLNRQKGMTEPLLCEQCESVLSAYERYVSLVWGGGSGAIFEKRGWGTIISSLDYAKFKLFQMSVLWRAAISTIPFFKDIRIGNKHESRLREMLSAAEPGEPHEYGCLMVAIISDDLEGKTVDVVLTPERIARLDGHAAYRFIFGSAGWVFVVSNHTANFRWKGHFLQRDGTIMVPVIKAEETDLFTRLAQVFIEQQKVPQPNK